MKRSFGGTTLLGVQMITVGVDLAAEVDRTALAEVAWTDIEARVVSVKVGVDDALIRERVAWAEKAGVDCPFGWPDAFVELVLAHRRGDLVSPPSSGREWRRGLALRETDIDVHARTGLTPLSVSADRIAHAAMRWAAVAAALQGDGIDCARDGSGSIAEVYPAAALKVWGMPHRGYKRTANRQARDALVGTLIATAPWLAFGEFEALCRESDDALDAVISALVARAVALGETYFPTNEVSALTEGWIHVPSSGLSSLLRIP